MSIFDRIKDWFEDVIDGDTVIVKQGDSLWAICKKAFPIVDNTEIQKYVDKIVELNPDITDPNLIYPGQKIKLPNSWWDLGAKKM